MSGVRLTSDVPRARSLPNDNKKEQRTELYRGVSIGSRGKTDKNNQCDKNDLTAYVVILKPKVRFTMEMIVFGSFLVLSLVAFACQQAAKATDQQKKSVSNANFIKFQRSFFLVYFLALFGDWLQVVIHRHVGFGVGVGRHFVFKPTFFRLFETYKIQNFPHF